MERPTRNRSAGKCCSGMALIVASSASGQMSASGSGLPPASASQQVSTRANPLGLCDGHPKDGLGVQPCFTLYTPRRALSAYTNGATHVNHGPSLGSSSSAVSHGSSPASLLGMTALCMHWCTCWIRQRAVLLALI